MGKRKIGMSIEDLRTNIDRVDGEIIRLLNERAELAQKIGEIKMREGLPAYAPEREEQVFRKLVERSKGPLRPQAIRAIYREIMSAALSLEKDLVIACLGEAGSPAHRAATAKFGSSVRYAFFTDTADVFSEVEKDQADCGVVPIDDAAQGITSPTLDELAATELSICAEIILGSDENAGDSDGPKSRFLVLGRQPNPPSTKDRTMLLLRIEDKPGALVSALEPFKELAINLSHFASRPASKGSKDIFFFVEADGHIREMQLADLFRELSKRCRAVKVLGSYPVVE